MSSVARMALLLNIGTVSIGALAVFAGFAGFWTGVSLVLAAVSLTFAARGRG